MQFSVVKRCNIFYIWKSVGETMRSYNFLCAGVSEQLIVRDWESVKKISLYARLVLTLFPSCLLLAFVGSTIMGQVTLRSDPPLSLLCSHELSPVLSLLGLISAMVHLEILWKFNTNVIPCISQQVRLNKFMEEHQGLLKTNTPSLTWEFDLHFAGE